MPQTFEDPELPDLKPKTSTFTVAMAVVVTLAVVVSLWFLFEPLELRKSESAHDTTTMSAADQEYAKQIEIGNITMSRAENFLHQEVTTLEGEIHNAGSQPISSLTLTAEFSDDMHQIVLRESRKVFANPANPLKPGERRAFEISFEHIPTSWNMQTPAMRVSQLQLSSTK